MRESGKMGFYSEKEVYFEKGVYFELIFFSEK